MRHPEFPDSPIGGGPLTRSAPVGRLRRLRPHILLLGGFVFGAVSGTCVKLFAADGQLVPRLLTWFVRPVEQLFLETLFLMIVPLLFSAIVSGVSRMRGNAGMQGLLAITLAYMLAVSAAAALIGLAMANLFRPGDGIPFEVGRQLLSAHVPYLAQYLGGFLPLSWTTNATLAAMIVLSFAIAAILPLLRKQNGHWLVSACDRIFAIGMKVLSLVTVFAPIAVACFMFDMTVMFGWHLLIYLSAYVAVVVAALALQVAITFSAVVWMRGDIAPTAFLHSVQESALIAFSTSSSNASLPTALKVAEGDLNLPARIARPVLGIGTISNQSGTTIYIAVTVLFISQFFGMDLTIDHQALIFLIATLAGMGTVGVPAGALPAVAALLALSGIPPEGIGLVIGVDRLLDMFRTLVNVVGDLAIASAIAREPVAAAPETRAVPDRFEIG